MTFQLDVDYRKFTEFGNVELFDLSDSEDEVDKERKRLKLPGTKHSDLSERSVRPSINISKLTFSPNGEYYLTGLDQLILSEIYL